MNLKNNKSVICVSTIAVSVAMFVFASSAGAQETEDPVAKQLLESLTQNQEWVANEQFMNDLVSISPDKELAKRPTVSGSVLLEISFPVGEMRFA